MCLQNLIDWEKSDGSSSDQERNEHDRVSVRDGSLKGRNSVVRS